MQCQAFFSFFTPKPAAPAVNPRAAELVEEVIALCQGTDAGLKASPPKKEAIAAAVAELSQYSIKAPLKSPLLFGEWKVLYASKPSAVGGPLRSAVGTTVFPGQNARQVIEAPNSLVNVVQYKTLGILPGTSRQYGEINPISPDTFVLNITRGEIKAGIGGTVEKEFNIQRRIQISYLDERLRVARFIPSAELEDDEAAGQGSTEEIIFVFERVAEAAEEDEPAAAGGAADGGEAEVPQAKPPAFLFGGTRKVETLATAAERQVMRQMQQEEAKRGGSSRVAARPASPSASVKVAVGSSRVSARGPAPAPPATGTGKVAVRRRGQPAEEVEEDPRERRRREAAEDKARKAAEADAKKAAEAKARAVAEDKARKVAEAEERARKIAEDRARAEAEKQAEREKAASIKALLARLGEQLKEAQAEARDSVKELKDLEKKNLPALKGVLAARARIEDAERDTAGVAEELGAASISKKEAEAAAKEAGAVLAVADKGLRAALAEAAPKAVRK